MNEEEIIQEEQGQSVAVSEQPVDDSQEDQVDGQKMVPLAAMLATRKKLQEAELRAAKAESAAQAYQDYVSKSQVNSSAEKEESDDPRAIVEQQHLRESNAHTKRDILETLYQDMN